ncbi:hypothetical protein HK105_200073 [Polyrhizophydium stewartii]|uniref:P-loop containing nucleoside triphosphate hydrolase protein n=1 Tax=Polyrhizophydium stewartii TaxID=2732419 RepID=A0ABR4NKF7_9FUNG
MDAKQTFVAAAAADAVPLPAAREPIRRNLFSTVAVSWISPLLSKGYRKPLVEEDLPLMPESQLAVRSNGTFDGFWARLREHRRDPQRVRPPLVSFTVLPHIAGILAINFVLELIALAISLLLPQMIPQIVQFLVPEPDGPTLIVNSGYGLAGILFAMMFVSALARSTIQVLTVDLSMRIRCIVLPAIYGKALRLSPKARLEYSAGLINNLVSTDIISIMNLFGTLNEFWAIPIRVGMSIYFLSKLLGPSVWAAGVTFFTILLIQGLVTPGLGKRVGAYKRAMDMRIKKLREFLYGIKVIKYQALEEVFLKQLTALRAEQIKHLAMFILFLTALFITIILQQTLTPAATFATYAILGNNLRAGTIFAALAYFDGLFQPLQFFFQAIVNITEFSVSMARIAKFLRADESQPDEVGKLLPAADSPDSAALKMFGAAFTWEEARKEDQDKQKTKSKKRLFGKKKRSQESTRSSETAKADKSDKADKADEGKKDDAESDKPAPFALQDITLDITRGSLVAVVGSVGSGKSSLLSALIGGMRKTAGDSALFGSVAYCAQEPWILTGTIEENIVFGDDSVRARIPAAVAAACLDRDLEILPNGLGTQIGEKGINLSGGQKARVALARAIARDADIYLLDDPIAALDAHVGKKVFDDAICGVLRGKTVFLVTHQLHLLPKVDMVVVLDEGRIVETGAFRELMAREDGVLAEIMKDYHFDDAETETAKETGDDEEGEDDKPENLIKVVKAFEEEKAIAEDRRTGAVTYKTFVAYFRAVGMWFLPTFIISAFVGTAVRLGPKIVLSYWASPRNELGLDENQYLRLFLGASAIDSVVFAMVIALLFRSGYLAGLRLHDTALTGLIRAPMGFFDGQPIGRILNRMSADVDQADLEMAQVLTNVIGVTIFMFVSLILIAIATPLLLIQFGILMVLLLLTFRFYQRSYREVNRLFSIMKSPILSHVSETMTGVSTIQAYSMQSRFTDIAYEKIDRYNLAVILLSNMRFWVILRTSILSATITFMVVVLASAGVVSTTFVGLALAESMSLTEMMIGLMMSFSNAEASFNSVERLDYYAKDLPAEAARELPMDPKDDAWPTAGAVAIRGLEIRYPSRPDHAVIQDLSLDIQPGEKVGVVGRTGSGKSTLMTALFRIMEASKGSIAIDGIDIASLGLKTLRSRLQIIPQDPVLFKGTVRSNLDFAGKYTDNELWAALDLVGLRDFVGSLDGKLDAAIDENGANLSMGQRQLMCLCKAILAKPKVLIMDEATASVDAEADKRIQESIETQFAATTVLSIAHRLNTIAAFDRVLVLDAGRIAEFDAPHVLLGRAGSVFGDMVEATGAANAAVIRQIAATHYAKRH